MKEHKRQRIVILGAGFGGVYTARHLEKLLGRSNDFDIILVNKENYFVFQPMLPEVVSGHIGLLDTVSPLRRLLPRTDIHVREVERVDLDNRTISTSPGFRPHSHIIAFDHLVLALGSVTDFRGLRGLSEHALPFKNLADALRLRNPCHAGRADLLVLPDRCGGPLPGGPHARDHALRLLCRGDVKAAAQGVLVSLVRRERAVVDSAPSSRRQTWTRS